MKIDLRKLYILNKIDINEEVIIPEEYYQKIDIIKVSPLKVKGNIMINNQDEIELNVNIKGIFILPCAISLEEVDYDFNIDLNEIIPETNKKGKFELELLDILWENIVLEVPIRVVKENLNTNNTSGKGWELIS
ncbi:MAG: hypothetical protein PHH51_01575 [Bacilli bacterium]|nr:hypothetical protein [Bacilli bacterium]MDD3895635.1 hypothetical protein [Bacilli bacterium]MDD4407702.1 hypothetical protein [Bacilli bacterium]